MLIDWGGLAARGFPWTDGVSVDVVARELSGMLVSRDPVVRDDYGYTATARWGGEGRLDGVLGVLGETAVERFAHPEVQARTFAPLVLRVVLDRGLVGEGDVRRWYGAFAGWYPRERDVRGWDDELGWLHAVAHGADAAAAFAKALPELRGEILQLCARRFTVTDTDYRYVQMEDARLARAITRILLAPGLTEAEATGWLDIVAARLEGGGPGAVEPWAFNTFATLQALHLHLARGLADGEGVPPHAPAVGDRVAELLRLPYYWLG